MSQYLVVIADWKIVVLLARKRRSYCTLCLLSLVVNYFNSIHVVVNIVFVSIVIVIIMVKPCPIVEANVNIPGVCILFIAMSCKMIFS